MVGDVWELWQRHAVAPVPLAAVAAALPPPSAIPPRPWLYGTALVRGFVSVLVAGGGVGKSALAMAQAVALASGQGFLGAHVHHAVPVWLLNLEDPLDELDRRLAAVLLRHRVAEAAVRGRIFLHSGRTRRLRLAELSPDGSVVLPDQAAMIEAARAVGAGCIIVDPFVKSHALDENSNPHMDAAATAWAEIAEAAGCAVLLVHHVRKGPTMAGGAGDVDSARGGKALTDAARVAQVLSAMSEEEAETLGVAAGERWRHVRLDDAKANLAPRGTRARWFRLEGIPLGNATQAYPHGDTVAVIAPWEPPSAWSRLDPAACNRILDTLAAGPEPGLLYAAQRRGRGVERWAGWVLVEAGGLSEAQAGEVIGGWLKSGLLVECEYRDTQQRKSRTGVRVVDAKRPTMNQREA